MTQKTIETKIIVFRFDELSEEYKNLLNKAKEQTKNAYAPYSKFYVGAAVLLENGEIVGGSNQENAAYPSGLCAERVAMFYANSHFPNVAVKALAVAAWTNGNFLTQPVTPCGACRQVLLETENRFKDFPVLLYGTDAVYVIEKAKDLLPLNFAKESLMA
jgi:cytidine deaminase